MSWDEKLFGWLYGALKRATEPTRSDAQQAREARLETLRGRLRLLATALAGERVEILEGVAEEGAVHGARIMLPAYLDLWSTPEENTRAYVVRVACAALALRHGIALPEGADDAPSVALATRLALPWLDASLADEMPAALAARIELARALPSAGGRTHPLSRSIELHLRAGAGPSPSDLEPLDRLFEDAPRDRVALAARLRALRGAPGLDLLERAGPIRPHPLVGWLGASPTRTLGGLGLETVDADSLPSGTERRGKAKGRVRQVELADDPAADSPLVHSFEKVQTAEEYSGGSRAPDGADELEEHAEALSELDVREVVRTREGARSVLRSDVVMESAACDLSDDATGELGASFEYDEWNHAERRYRKSWCAVRLERLAPRHGWADAEARVAEMARSNRRACDLLRGELLRLDLSRRWRGRQRDGPAIDVDAMIDRHASLASGHSPPERLYMDRRRHSPSLAVVVLVDGSLSTDGWVSDRRVLDVELEASVVLGEVLDGLDVGLGLAAFRSNTRRDCRFVWLKGIDEPWKRARPRLGALEPAGYTRIGPAIRHATDSLARTAARRRMLLVVTDGKPTDYDRYEGRYGIADVRQAVREAEASAIRVDALAVDPDARFTLPAMFGAARHHTLRAPADLPLAVGAICAEMRL